MPDKIPFRFPSNLWLCFRSDDRFSKTEEEVLKELAYLFSAHGYDRKLLDFVIVVFTYIEDDQELEELLNPTDSPKPLEVLRLKEEICDR